MTTHVGTAKHKGNTKDIQSSRSLAMFLPGSSKSSTDNITQSVINAETLFQSFIIEHNLPLTINDHLTRLTRRMFPTSEIAKSYSCGRTKVTHITYAAAITSDSLKSLKHNVASNK